MNANFEREGFLLQKASWHVVHTHTSAPPDKPAADTRLLCSRTCVDVKLPSLSGCGKSTAEASNFCKGINGNFSEYQDADKSSATAAGLGMVHRGPVKCSLARFSDQSCIAQKTQATKLRNGTVFEAFGLDHPSTD